MDAVVFPVHAVSMLRENEVSHQLKTRYYSSLPRAAKHPQLRFERWQ